VFIGLAGGFVLLAALHAFVLPRPEADRRAPAAARHLVRDFLAVFAAFFRKPELGVLADPHTFLVELAGAMGAAPDRGAWMAELDARDAARTTASSPVLGAASVRMHLLPHGATFDPRTGTATLPAAIKP
jgi:hypothetical protein